MKKIFALFLAILIVCQTIAQNRAEDSAYIVNNYVKMERMIPMRDGIKLFTAIYAPKNTSDKHPILLVRTPYSCAPYGEKEFRQNTSEKTTSWYIRMYVGG
jgi:predicted acyl esterase